MYVPSYSTTRYMSCFPSGLLIFVVICVSSYHYMCPDTTICVSSYHYMCPQTTCIYIQVKPVFINRQNAFWYHKRERERMG
jgi:hypothetical protein